MSRKHLSIIVLMLLVFSLSLLLYGCGTDKARDDQKAGVAKSGGQQQVDIIRLAGGDWGYLSPYAHYPRGPGSPGTCLYKTTFERGL